MNGPGARWLADRHYSRQTPGARDFLASGETLVLVTLCGRAVWGVVHNLDRTGTERWRVTIFRNEGAGLSSALVQEGTERTRLYWARHYGGEPRVRLTTEVDPAKVRRKRDPGRCFRRAGWEVLGMLNPDALHGRPALLQLAAPERSAAATAPPVSTGFRTDAPKGTVER